MYIFFEMKMLHLSNKILFIGPVSKLFFSPLSSFKFNSAITTYGNPNVVQAFQTQCLGNIRGGSCCLIWHDYPPLITTRIWEAITYCQIRVILNREIEGECCQDNTYVAGRMFGNWNKQERVRERRNIPSIPGEEGCKTLLLNCDWTKRWCHGKCIHYCWSAHDLFMTISTAQNRNMRWCIPWYISYAIMYYHRGVVTTK